MSCNVTYQPPVWNELASRKHRCNGRNAERRWEISLLTGDTQNRKSLYSPYLTQQKIRDIEMQCVKEALANTGQDIEEIKTGICHVKRFYIEHDIVIGASQGRQTKYSLVQYDFMGNVHGYPITEAYLSQQLA